MMKLIIENWRKYLKEQHSSDFQIYCDMDGVLVNFELGAVDFINKDLQNGKVPELVKSLGRDFITAEDLKKNVKENLDTIKYMKLVIGNNEEFWTNLPWMPDGQELWTAIASYNPFILTSPMKEGSKTGKRNWIVKNLSPQPEKIFIADDKYRWADKRSILIDDWLKNTGPFRQAGGIAILHTSATDTISKLNVFLKSV